MTPDKCDNLGDGMLQGCLMVIVAVIVVLGISQCGKSEDTTVPVSTTQVSSADKAATKEAIATVLNLNGHLCARIVDVKPLEVGPNMYEVTCVEYRGGSGQVRYILDAEKGTAFKT